MAVQSNINHGTSVSTLTCTYTLAQRVGNTNVIWFSAQGTVDLNPVTVNDTEGNSYTPQLLLSGGTTAPSIWSYSAANIKAAAAGSNTVTIDLAHSSNTLPLVLGIIETYPFVSVDDAEDNTGATGPIASVTVVSDLDDYISALIVTGAEPATAGTIAATPANQLQTYNPGSGAGYCLEDGTGNSSPIVTVTGNVSAATYWAIGAIALVVVNPTAVSDPLFFGTNA